MDTPEKPKRRPRYKGTHPKKFGDKYKELNPDRYPDEIKKAREAGKTPAGTHVPICMKEIIDVLKPKPGHLAADATLGYGGHAIEILRHVTPGGRLFGFDLDGAEGAKTEARIRGAGFSETEFVRCAANFDTMPASLRNHGVEKVNLVLADLGISSMQLDNPERGFSYKVSGPLDLRLNPAGKITAAHFLKCVTEKDLVQLLEENSDEVYAQEIAAAIIKQQRIKAIDTTDALTEAVRLGLAHLPARIVKEVGNRPVRRVFQAIRIAVNHEFRSLDRFLSHLPSVLERGGRVAILTFHSGEDRRVKKAFKDGIKLRHYAEIARDVIRPTPQEIYNNPRAKSAKLRWAIRY